MNAARWRVSGRVQGVGFRWFVQRTASELGLRGDVANLRDGSVEVRAAGTATALEALHEALTRGPSGARVDRVAALEPVLDLPEAGFHIRREAEPHCS